MTAPDLAGVRELIDQQSPYFLTLAGNGQLALAIFLVLFGVVFFVGAYRKRASIARARAKIPLSIGGWGTRGKSGTERLKAAMFQGLGYEVTVKTTGCEAMLIHSVPDQPPHEIFIFRSYDKSSIWEQRDVVETAAAFDSEVFLWECMALQPEFVQLLQHDWMRDDYVTLTNAFPDHEDIQGPAGVDVATCISSFIPKSSRLLTSELEFLPMFRERAAERRTTLEAIDPYEGDLIAADVLALFPYEEHPRNIALVAKLSEELGIDRHLAMATMAEHVVPDLGVLKAYPPASVRGRKLTFINGMSANERTGFLNNWNRMELATKDVETMPGEMIITVVNNRWDRVSRSEVFARIMVEDAIVDAHVLIGTNLRGLRRYIDEALHRYCAAIEVVIASDLSSALGPDRARHRLAVLLARQRVAKPAPKRIVERIQRYATGAGLTIERRAELGQLAKKLCEPGGSLELSAIRREVAAQLASLPQMLVAGDEAAPDVVAPADSADVIDHVIRQTARIVLHARLVGKLDHLFATRGDIGSFNQVVRDAYRKLFEDQLVTVEDPAETGDQIIDRCARAVPPGTQVSVMGVQNIKGTGLDFVYRWLALDQTLARLGRLASEDREARLTALREIEAFEDYGMIDASAATEALARYCERKLDEEETQQAQTTLERVRAVYAERTHALAQAEAKSVGAKVVGGIEAVLDPLDSVRRRRRARAIMTDLIDKRISHGRAAKEMRALYDRQGGGWLWHPS